MDELGRSILVQGDGKAFARKREREREKEREREREKERKKEGRKERKGRKGRKGKGTQGQKRGGNPNVIRAILKINNNRHGETSQGNHERRRSERQSE